MPIRILILAALASACGPESREQYAYYCVGQARAHLQRHSAGASQFRDIEKAAEINPQPPSGARYWTGATLDVLRSRGRGRPVRSLRRPVTKASELRHRPRPVVAGGAPREGSLDLALR